MPERLVIRLRDSHQQFVEEIIQQALTSKGLSQDDYVPHGHSWKSKLFIVLDIGSLASSTLCVNTIKYTVYSVNKDGESFTFTDLGLNAAHTAREAMWTLAWRN